MLSRHPVTALLAPALLAIAAPALLLPAAPLAAREASARAVAPSAELSREGARVHLRWGGLTGPVQVRLAERPDADWAAATPLAVAQGGEIWLDLPAWPRPYMLLRDAAGQQLVVAERLLPLEGGNNFRDLGGYRTADGSHVIWGRLYRSAVMAGLTPDDFTRLGQLGITTVCDFRSTDERTREAVAWPAGVQPTVLATDYGLDLGACHRVGLRHHHHVGAGKLIVE